MIPNATPEDLQRIKREAFDAVVKLGAAPENVEVTIENLAQIAVPTLLIYEQNSPFIETQQILSRQLPDCTPVFLADSTLRHFSPLEQPDEILLHVKNFLQPSEIEVPVAITEG